MLVWQCPTLNSIDGIKVDLPERQNAEFYFMEKGHEPVFPQLDSLQQTPPMVADEALNGRFIFFYLLFIYFVHLESKYRAWPVKQPSSKGAYQKNWNNNMKP